MTALSEHERQIVNKCSAGFRVIAITVPMPAIRIICSDDECTFRVEQLRQEKWTTLTTVNGKRDKNWFKDNDTQYAGAIQAMCEARAKFIQEMRRLSVERNQINRLQESGKL